MQTRTLSAAPAGGAPAAPPDTGLHATPVTVPQQAEPPAVELLAAQQPPDPPGPATPPAPTPTADTPDTTETPDATEAPDPA
ncbi:RNA polymerase sigma factor, partial [Streptomyces diastatochromogenes]